MPMKYIVEVQQNGRIVKTELVGSSSAAQSVAMDWRRKGCFVTVKTETNGSTPYGGGPIR